MLALVTCPKSINLSTCPETLLMDVCRISSLQLDYQRAVKAATVVVTTNQAVASNSKNLTVGDLKVYQDEVVAKIFSSEEFVKCIDGKFGNTVELIDKVLERTTMAPQTRQALTMELMGINEPSHAVRKLM
jgi:hypothetical protein